MLLKEVELKLSKGIDMKDNVITLDDMRKLSIEEIITLYRNGYMLEQSHTITTLQDCSSGCVPEYYTGLGFLVGMAVGMVVTFLSISDNINKAESKKGYPTTAV